MTLINLTFVEQKIEEKIYELADLKGHSKEEDCWLVIDGEVYDVTEFLDEHPGGFDIILASTGRYIFSESNSNSSLETDRRCVNHACYIWNAFFPLLIFYGMFVSIFKV